MSSYQAPIKRNNEFSTIFNSIDYDVNLSSKSNPITFNDSRYLKSSGTTVSSNAALTLFNSLAVNSLKVKQKIDTFTNSTLGFSTTFDFAVSMIYYMEITSLTNSLVLFSNIPTTSQQSYVFTFFIKPTTNSKIFINPLNNLLSVNGVLNVPIYGISNVVLPLTFNFIIQQITIINSSITTTPNYIAVTSVFAY